MIHELKILKSFADAIISGDKTFEVRHNDRGFQKKAVITIVRDIYINAISAGKCTNLTW